MNGEYDCCIGVMGSFGLVWFGVARDIAHSCRASVGCSRVEQSCLVLSCLV